MAGGLPFYHDHLEQSYRGQYYPRTGSVWTGISDTAKECLEIATGQVTEVLTVYHRGIR